MSAIEQSVRPPFSNMTGVNHRIERRYLGLALLLVGALGGATAVLLLQCRRSTAKASAHKTDHDERCRDMVAEGGPVMEDAGTT